MSLVHTGIYLQYMLARQAHEYECSFPRYMGRTVLDWSFEELATYLDHIESTYQWDRLVKVGLGGVHVGACVCVCDACARGYDIC